MQLPEQQIQIQIQNKLALQPLQRKRSFCRFFLRGLCIFQEKQCQFSHGIHDLFYQQWKSEEVIQFDYLKDTDFTQKKAIKGPRVYKNLYEFQKQKIFTLDQLNEDRKKRQIVRKELHGKLFNDFMQLIEQKYPEGKFTEEFLVREYTRVGFNKLMTRIKFTHLLTFLNSNQTNQYFQLNIVMPPYTKQQTTFLVKKAKEHLIDQYYKSAYQQILQEYQAETIDQGKLKKLLYNYPKESIHIPPLNIHLKDKKLSFSAYLRKLLGENIVELQVKLEADLETLLESSKKFLQSNNLVEWNEVYKHLSKEHKINNANILNQVKPMLVLEGYRFLFFPMTQFITHLKAKSKILYSQNNPCPCNFKKLYKNEELSILSSSQKDNKFELQPQVSYDIYDIETLVQCSSAILNSKVIAVDLQGRLRKNGYIQMIQLNNQTNTFLIDIFRMDLNGDIEAFELSKRLLRNVLANEEILKIFHDCRHDSLALHQFMQSCIVNVFDTSATQTYINQIQIYQKLDGLVAEELEQHDKNYQKKLKQRQNKAKQTIAHVNNVKTPGLNQILKTYQAPHGINKNKQLFHSMWNKGQTSLFDQRPLNPDFRQYCIKDVLDLPFCYFKMIKQTQKSQFDLELAKWISSQYVRYGYQSTEEGEEKK